METHRTKPRYSFRITFFSAFHRTKPGYPIKLLVMMASTTINNYMIEAI